ncbi:helix-turn-helix domain-containing protein [Nonomuraea sp. NPDC046802]|uniref:TetR/AcrR family transcriptional regulator n=1 Tax=Nonomuraea sp. NPDC046802 TaxID=3154919 RepID=UPI0033F4D0AB
MAAFHRVAPRPSGGAGCGPGDRHRPGARRSRRPAGATLPKVAEALGITKMSLYRYVGSKDELFTP